MPNKPAQIIRLSRDGGATWEDHICFTVGAMHSFAGSGNVLTHFKVFGFPEEIEDDDSGTLLAQREIDEVLSPVKPIYVVVRNEEITVQTPVLSANGRIKRNKQSGRPVMEKKKLRIVWFDGRNVPQG